MPAGAQSLRLEDPICAQERWQRDFDRGQQEQREQTRGRERDEAILRELQDQARELRMRDEDREDARDHPRGGSAEGARSRLCVQLRSGVQVKPMAAAVL